MRCSHLDGHRRRTRPPIAFAGRPGRASAALLLWVPALSPRTHAWKITLSSHEGFWCRRSTALSSSWVSNLGESTVKETNRSFDRSRSKFADPRYRPRGRITKSVTVTTTYNRTIFSGTAASAQYKMAKAALHLNFEKCVLRIETVCVPAIPHHIWKLCVQNSLMLYGLLIRSASDPYSGPTLGKGGGCFASSTTSERRRAKWVFFPSGASQKKTFNDRMSRGLSYG